MIRILSFLMLVAVCMACILPSAHAAEYRNVMSFKDLMDPTIFRDAQFGMKIESAKSDRDVITVKTTGAVFSIYPKLGLIQAYQRIGLSRQVAQIRIGAAFSDARITDRTSGFVMISNGNPGLRIRINGDSLLMVQPTKDMSLRAETLFQHAWSQTWRTGHLLVDEMGGIFSYHSSDQVPDNSDVSNHVLASCTVQGGEVFCLGVCAPKPYDWKKSVKSQVVWHWSAKDGYPTDTRIHDWKSGGNILLAQSEVLLWKDWNLAFVPRKGEDEFARMVNTAHKNNQRVIVYTSPFFFLKGTELERFAVNDKPGYCPPNVSTGVNMPLFLKEIERVMRDYAPDGLYFDGQYNVNPAALYALARYSRQVVGEKGLLEWHSSIALGDLFGQEFMYFPQADAYIDIILRGEGVGHLYSDFNFLRFFVSGYNIHNSIGVLCNNQHFNDAPPEMVENILRANARIHTMVNEDSPNVRFSKGYERRLQPDFKDWVDSGVRERYINAGVGR
jgi:hypothetical protein